MKQKLQGLMYRLNSKMQQFMVGRHGADEFGRFMRSIKKGTSANIAFIIDGTEANAAKIVEMAKTNDSNVIDDDILYINGGLPFKFMRKVTDEESAQVKTWVERILARLK